MQQSFIRSSNFHNIDHHKAVARLSKEKVILQKTLDKRIDVAFMNCPADKKSKLCKIIWNDVDSCLEEIDNINQEIKYHNWYIYVEE